MTLKKILAGLLFCLIGIFFCYFSLFYHVGSASDMGPGYFPYLISRLLIAVGILTAIVKE